MTIHIPSSNGEPAEPTVTTALPSQLPILPLRDSVAFPETLTPLAIGQERSIALINDVLAGDRMLVMVASRDPEIEEPGPGRPLSGGCGGRGGAHAEGARRHASDPGPRRPAGRPGGMLRPHRALPRRADGGSPRHRQALGGVEALHRNVQATFSRIIEELPDLPEELAGRWRWPTSTTRPSSRT